MLDFVKVFDQLQELRGWLWESYFSGKQNDPKEFDKVLDTVKIMLKAVATRYELNYVED